MYPTLKKTLTGRIKKRKKLSFPKSSPGLQSYLPNRQQEVKMRNSLTQQRFLIRLIIIGSLISACSLLPSGSPNPGNSDGKIAAEPTPTPTPEAVFQTEDTPEVKYTPEIPDQGEIELNFIDPLSQEKCTAHFPFKISHGEQNLISGSGIIDCAFAVQQCGDGVCVTYHSIYKYDGVLPRRIAGGKPGGHAGYDAILDRSSPGCYRNIH
jgi:hypothetical protein